MKKILFIIIFSLSLSFEMYADNEEFSQIYIEHTHQGGDHSGIPTPADMPDVYYGTTNQEIIIDGLGVVNYYDVEIASATSFVTVISTQVNGSYDTIDISSLPQGEYVITIESPWGNTYEGFLDTY